MSDELMRGRCALICYHCVIFNTYLRYRRNTYIRTVYICINMIIKSINKYVRERIERERELRERIERERIERERIERENREIELRERENARTNNTRLDQQRNRTRGYLLMLVLLPWRRMMIWRLASKSLMLRCKMLAKNG